MKSWGSKFFTRYFFIKFKNIKIFKKSIWEVAVCVLETKVWKSYNTLINIKKLPRDNQLFIETLYVGMVY